MELVAEGAIAKWRKLIGPTNCQVAKQEAPNSLRALFGTEGVRNACHGSDSRKIGSVFL
jgi:nucleoside-diphosphate kinase